MNERPPQHIQNVRITRRSFGLGGSVALASGMGYLGKEYADEAVVSEPTESSLFEAETINTPETYDELSNSGYFNEDVERYTEGYQAEAPTVILENRDVYRAVQDYFILPNIEHSFLREQLEMFAPALAFVESRYKNDLSEVGAFGVMQLMPATWEELSLEGEDKNDLQVQIIVAARLMEQSYRHVMSSCAEQLELIKQNHFGGDTKAFEIEFLTPLFLNSYNAGMGSMELLVKEFAIICPQPEDTKLFFDDRSEVLTGYDVFIGMAHTGNHRGWADWYKDEASNYTCKVYGAHTAVAEYFKQQQSENG